jgi:NADPH:quinone reductase-like Zn-dependent oxidoreductase
MKALVSQFVPAFDPSKWTSSWPDALSQFVDAELIEISNSTFPEMKGGRCVEIEVLCGGLNYRDMISVYEGLLGIEGNSRTVFGCEIAGIVRNVSPEVTTVSIGDRVTTVCLGYCGSCRLCSEGKMGQCRHSGPISTQAFMERVIVPEEGVRKIPAGVSFLDAAAFSFSGTAAYSIVHEIAHIKTNDTVLITAANSALGAYATQFAVKAGAVVACLSRSRETAIKSLDYGARFAGTLEDVTGKESGRRALRRIVGTSEFNYVLDFAVDSYSRDCVGLMAYGGVYVMCGLVMGSQMLDQASFRTIIERNLSVSGFAYHHRSFDSAMNLLALGGAHSIIDSVYRAEDIRSALRRAWWSGERYGKVVLLFADEEVCRARASTN